MANMSYCRWENTSNDMADCVESMEDTDFDSLSEYEKQGFLRALSCANRMLGLAPRALLEEAGVHLA